MNTNTVYHTDYIFSVTGDWNKFLIAIVCLGIIGFIAYISFFKNNSK